MEKQEEEIFEILSGLSVKESIHCLAALLAVFVTLGRSKPEVEDFYAMACKAACNTVGQPRLH